MSSVRKTLLLLLLAVSHNYVAQCDDPVAEFLKGVWVKDSQPADTIRFGMSPVSPYNFELVMAGVNRPQPGPAGLYEYRALQGAMLIHWIPAGSFIPRTISFFVDKDREHITLGNFYRPGNPVKTFQFRRLKS